MEKREMKGGVFNECLLMNIFRPGVRTNKGKGAEGEGGQPNADRGSGGQESLEMCGHPLWMAPYHSI